jgi:hypothetical protein
MASVSGRLQADDLSALATTLSEPECSGVPDLPPAVDQVHISDLPDNVVRIIAQFCLQSGGRQSSILSLLAMCGVCKHWRKSASFLSPGSSLLFDGTKATGTASSTLEQKYRTLPQAERTRILHAAASLFRGTALAPPRQLARSFVIVYEPRNTAIFEVNTYAFRLLCQKSISFCFAVALLPGHVTEYVERCACMSSCISALAVVLPGRS